MVALDPGGVSGSKPRRRARANASRAIGGTAVRGAWSSMASAGSGSSVDPGASAVGPTSMARAPQAAACSTTSAVAARPGPFGARATTTRAGSDDRRHTRGHLPGLRALRVDDGHLLELECGFQRGDARHSAADDEQVGGVDELHGERIDEGLGRGDGGLGVVRRQLDLTDRGIRPTAPSSSSSSSSVATSVAEKVLVMTGTSLGPPLERTTSRTIRVSVEPGTWTIPTTGTRSRHASATATTSRNSPDAEIPTIASPSPSAGGYVRNAPAVIGMTAGSSAIAWRP